VDGEITSVDDLRGIEYDWLACDADCHVGLFSTAGGGYVPEKVWPNIDAHDAAIAAILDLPPSTTARFAPKLRAGLPNTWRLAAERGLFAFDSDFFGGPYNLVASPMTPVHADEFPVIVVEVLSQLQYHQLNFSTWTIIAADSLRP
jgi:hypothetical protein